MTLYSEKIYEKVFTDEVSKQAYLKACKWLAKYVYGTNINQYINVKIEKKNADIPTFIVSLFVSIEEQKNKTEFCLSCQRINSIFYSVEKLNCDQCKLQAYMRNREKYIAGIVDLCKGVICSEEN